MKRTFWQGNEIGKGLDEKLHIICDIKVRLVCHYVNSYGILEKNQDYQ